LSVSSRGNADQEVKGAPCLQTPITTFLPPTLLDYVATEVAPKSSSYQVTARFTQTGPTFGDVTRLQQPRALRVGAVFAFWTEQRWELRRARQILINVLRHDRDRCRREAPTLCKPYRPEAAITTDARRLISCA
jgi:hypothetical protein